MYYLLQLVRLCDVFGVPHGEAAMQHDAIEVRSRRHGNIKTSAIPRGLAHRMFARRVGGHARM
jgi:hypothetical protein